MCEHRYYIERQGWIGEGISGRPDSLVLHICSSCGEEVGRHYDHRSWWD